MRSVSRLALLSAVVFAVALSSVSCANSCESLCDAYFQMELRCELLSCDACATSSTCGDGGAQSIDANVLVQETEYKIGQCQADYRRLVEEEDGSSVEGAACQSYLGTVEGLVQQYDDTADGCERRLLCDQYADLQQEMGLTQ